MAYPNSTEVSAAASTAGVDPLVEFAYAAIHGRTVTDPATVQAFETQVQGMAAAGYRPQWTTLLYGYIQSHGTTPSGVWDTGFIQWAIAQGYLTPPGPGSASPADTGNVPFAGEGYPPGNAPVDATAPTTPTTTPTPPNGLDLSGLLKNPLVLGGAALAGAYAFGLIGHRR